MASAPARSNPERVAPRVRNKITQIQHDANRRNRVAVDELTALSSQRSRNGNVGLKGVTALRLMKMKFLRLSEGFIAASHCFAIALRPPRKTYF